MDAGDLYGLPLDRFTPERNALAKQLRGEGKRDEASRVAAARKPSVAAWAVNQLVRTQSRDVKALFDAGDALQQAQSRLLAGRADAGALRKAADRERAAVDGLMAKARGLLSSQGHELSPTTLERVSETLNAAALDEDARAQVKEGCLDRELRHVGLGAGMPVAASARPAPAMSKAKQRDDSAERERKQRVGAARRAEAGARRAAEQAAKELKTAEDRLAQAKEVAREAEARVRGARERAKTAEKEHQRTKRELERA